MEPRVKLAGCNELIDHPSRCRRQRFHGLLPEGGVVLPPLGFIPEHFVSFLNGLEKQRVPAFIRMMLYRESAVGSSNRIVFSVGRYSEGLIMSQLAGSLTDL